MKSCPMIVPAIECANDLYQQVSNLIQDCKYSVTTSMLIFCKEPGK